MNFDYMKAVKIFKYLIFFLNCNCVLAASAQLKVVGRFLQDGNRYNVMLRGVNVDANREGYVHDIAAVSVAVATTQTNAVRLAWWTHNAGSPEATSAPYNTVAYLDEAITAFAAKGILPVLMLHDLTGKADSNQFKNIITNFWISPAVVTIINKHKDHLIVNIANEWGPNYNTNQNNDSPADITNFVRTYKSAIIALRNAGITVPLMIDADHYADNEVIFTSNSYGQGVSNGQYLINVDPLHNLMFSVHTYYWTYQNADPTVRINAVVSSGLPIVIGEEGNLLPDGSVVIDYPSLLSKANANNIGYFAWSWYNDGTGDNTGTNSVPFWMNMTIGTPGTGDGVTIPTTLTQNAWGFNMLNAAAYGINATNTQKVVFTGVLPLSLINFTASEKNGFDILEWKTANEINTKLFEVEYSLDGINFNAIGTVAVNNNTGNYSFKYEIASLNSNCFYRLKIIDIDGSFTYSNIISLYKNDVNSNGLKLSPNPTNGFTTLVGIGNDLINTQAELMDNSGKVLKIIQIISNIIIIDLSIYTNGLYLLKLANSKVFKVIKE